MSEKSTIFVSYSRKDDKAKDFIVGHLKVLEEHSELRFWHDQDMAGGDAWEKEIDQRLRDCVAAIILISRKSLTSEFILRTEVRLMLERYHHDGLRIYPIVIENCLWRKLPWLVAMNVRPDRGLPLMRQTPGKRDDIMVAIGEEIADLLLKEKDEAGGGEARTDARNGADFPTGTNGKAATPLLQSLSGWGSPFAFDEPETTSSAAPQRDRLSIEPAPAASADQHSQSADLVGRSRYSGAGQFFAEAGKPCRAVFAVGDGVAG